VPEAKKYFTISEIVLWCSSVLIVLWVMASLNDAKYVSVVVCFVAFLVNDIYGYISWKKMKSRQERNA